MRDVYTNLAEEILAKLSTLPERQKLIIAIAGVPGSGKSTTASAVCEELNKRTPGICQVLPMDGFHLYRRELDLLPDPKEAHERRGSPWTFNPAGLVELLKTIREQGEACAPSFDHSVGDPVEKAISIQPEHRVVLLEGNYLLLDEGDWAQVRELVDDCWFIQVDLDEAMERVVRRHMAAWGWDEEQARARVEYNDRPNAELIATTQANARKIVPSLPL